MTDEQIECWKTERDVARTIANKEDREAAIEKVNDHRDEMMMRCISHQSLRQKNMINDLKVLQSEIPELKKAANEFNSMKLEARGARKLMLALRYIIAAGGGAVILEIIQRIH